MRRLSILVTIAAATLLAVSTPALAAAPVHERVTVDDTFTWSFCGFPVQERLTGTLQFISWFDESGARTRQIVTAPGARITWTNLSTGASVTSANTYVAHKRDNPDGTVTIAFTGIVFSINGGGRAHVDSGRELIVFSPGNVQLLSSVGPTADLCEALTAAIG